MRPIKFRAWDKRLKKWRYSDDSDKVHYFWIFVDDYLDSKTRKTLTQFTGLKDENEKEIYEGDICKNGDWEQDAHVYNYRTEIVEWDKYNACWQGTNPNEDGMICKVIGNIYENPELLKK